jgi:hypothetical protein
MNMRDYLRKKPDISKRFQLMTEWPDVADTELDSEALSLYDANKDKENKPYCNLREISANKDKASFLAFLRYDYKKVLVRTRYLYLV